jgi:hypothetical protein
VSVSMCMKQLVDAEDLVEVKNQHPQPSDVTKVPRDVFPLC